MVNSKRAPFLSFFIALLGLLLALSFFVAPVNVLAQQCHCWCASNTGAFINGQAKLDGNYIEACSDACEAADGSYTGCLEQGVKPPSAARCWTQSECVNSEVILANGKPAKSIWAADPTPECARAKFSDSGQEERFCYSPPNPVTLNIAIETLSGNGKEVADLGTYIIALYNFMIPAASIIAVVLIMIAGFQYIMAAGSQERIAKAKERIQKAIIGLVLILGAYTIVNLVDPRLTSFDNLRIPRIRPVLFLDQSASCETLEEYFDISPNPGGGVECGDKGTLNAQKDGIPAGIVGSFEVGSECNYAKCDGAGKRCVASAGSGTELFCARCSASGNDNSEAPIPTPSNCAQFETAPPGVELPGDPKILCEYDNFWGDECVEVVYPSATTSPSLDCDALRRDSRARGTESCRAYDLVGLIRGDGSSIVTPDNFYSSTGTFEVPSAKILAELCIADPCGLSGAGSCVMYSSWTRVDCAHENDDIGKNDTWTDLLQSVFSSGAEYFAVDPKDVDFSGQNCQDVNGDIVSCQNTW